MVPGSTGKYADLSGITARGYSVGQRGRSIIHVWMASLAWNGLLNKEVSCYEMSLDINFSSILIRPFTFAQIEGFLFHFTNMLTVIWFLELSNYIIHTSFTGVETSCDCFSFNEVTLKDTGEIVPWEYCSKIHNAVFFAMHFLRE